MKKERKKLRLICSEVYKLKVGGRLIKKSVI